MLKVCEVWDRRCDVHHDPCTLDWYIWFFLSVCRNFAYRVRAGFFVFTVTVLNVSHQTRPTSPNLISIIKSSFLSSNTKCLHLFTTYCIIVTLELTNSLHSYAVKAISLLLSQICFTYLCTRTLHMPLSISLNTESLFTNDRSLHFYCFCLILLCKSLQNIALA